MGLSGRARRVVARVIPARATFVALVLLAAQSAVIAQSAGDADATRELLNSERIAAAFGSYSVEVLSSDGGLRVSSLYSEDDRGRTTRTFALVRYPASVDPAFAEAHATILAGGSIGATLRADGWRVIKAHRYFGEMPSTPRLERLMRLERGAPLAIHVYVLDIARADSRFEYATIAEIHHPDYLTLGDLRRIYAPGWRAPAANDSLVGAMLDVVATQTR